jgi:hypothetical protein
MKKIAVIFVLIALLVQTFSRFVIIANYELNKDYISKVLCENRNKPMMHCNGKCQLKKQLDKEEKQEQSPTNPLKEKNEVQFFQNSKSAFPYLSSSFLTDRISFSNSYISDKHLLSIFHPPTV